ncbi:MAG: hypothetical protein COA43_04410 [Robiginitomaculum sp.]|nr:MAG: hypothetical protein COA43_04410 [Robiginitomaculum sp.]
MYLVDSGEYTHDSVLSNALILFVFSYFIWFVFLTILGGPIWYFLHKKQKTHWVYAIFSGAIIPFIIVFAMEASYFTGKKSSYGSYYANGKQLWIDGVLTSAGWVDAFSSALYYSAVGTCISIVIWYVAYGTQKKVLKKHK